MFPSSSCICLTLGYGRFLVSGLLRLVDLVPEGERHSLRFCSDPRNQENGSNKNAVTKSLIDNSCDRSILENILICPVTGVSVEYIPDMSCDRSIRRKYT